MGDQEISFLQEGLHHLSTVCDHSCAAAAAAKRHSPLQLQEPAPKRTSPPSRDFLGFKKLTLPADFSAASAAPPPLRRTLSEPVYSLGAEQISVPHPAFNRQAAAASGTPPRPPARRNHPSRSPSCGESPNAKRLKRMKERLREMEKWWNEVATEDDDDSENDKDSKEENEDDVETHHPSQEAVFVEKSGGCLVLHFKCPCGSGYQILLSGNDCYYKLTNF